MSPRPSKKNLHMRRTKLSHTCTHTGTHTKSVGESKTSTRTSTRTTGGYKKSEKSSHSSLPQFFHLKRQGLLLAPVRTTRAAKRSRPIEIDVDKDNENANADENDLGNNNPDHLHVKKSDLNISAGGVIYERAKSRRQRHRLALMASEQCISDAVPLGTSGKSGKRGRYSGRGRGPGCTADLPRDVAQDKTGRVNLHGYGHRHYEHGEVEKVRELINKGKQAAEKSKLDVRKLPPRYRNLVASAGISPDARKRSRIENASAIGRNSNRKKGVPRSQE